MAKPLADLRVMQRDQLSRLTKNELIESILAPREEGEERTNMNELTEKVNMLVLEKTQLKNAITSPDSIVNKKISALQEQVNRQAEVIASQQRFLEVIDRKERETKLVITGEPDENESLEGATTEEDKLQKIWSNVGVTVEGVTHWRLGKPNGGERRRPILVTLPDKQLREKILDKAKNLKQANGEYQKIYVKKDVHPSVRKEWKRLRDAEKSEKERPENVGRIIHFDAKERKLYRDGVVIDSWKQPYF